jgi:Helix-turn-helix
MNKDAFAATLERYIKQSGSQEMAAQRLGISASYLSDVKKGRREPGDKILAALGLKRVVGYERIAMIVLMLLSLASPLSAQEKDSHPLRESLTWGAAMTGAAAFDLGTTISWSSKPASAFTEHTCTEATRYLANADGTANGPKSFVVKGALTAGLVGVLYVAKRWHIKPAEVVAKAAMGAQMAEWTWAGISSVRLCR